MKKRNLTILVAAILSATALAGCKQVIENPEYTTNSDGKQIITEYTAKRAAAKRAEANIDDIEYLRSDLAKDDGKHEYDIEFIYDGFEYDIEVDATDGSINSYEKEKIDKDKSTSEKTSNTSIAEPDNNQNKQENKIISEDDALSLGLKRAELENISKEDLTNYRIELDKDDGLYEYELDFIYDGFEYEIVIDAVGSNVLKFEREPQFKTNPDNPADNQSENTDSVISEEPTLIERDTALATALKHAEVKESEIYDLDIELDKEQNIVKYEIDFNYGGYEYSYDINALDGSIIKSNKEFDD